MANTTNNMSTTNVANTADMANTANPANMTNKDRIVAYITNGIKAPNEPKRLGVELEHFITDEAGYAVPYEGAFGIASLLQELAPNYDTQQFSDSGALIGLVRPGAALSLEPAAQLELSAGPYEDIGPIRYDFEEFHRALSRTLEARKERIILQGYQPRAKADDLALIPKTRYRLMDAHFQTIGSYGRFMMRGSASTQISIDFTSVEDCVRKLRLTSAASPLFALLCDNAPVFEGAPRTHELIRTEIWRKCDPARCGLIPHVLEPGFTLGDYADYLLSTPAIYVEDANGTPRATEQSFGEIFAKTPMQTADIEHALSMVFNDVRLKTYIEIRPADAMPVPFVVAYAALIKGLFYSADNLDALDELFAGVTHDAVEEAKTQLMAHGYQAVVYGRPAAELVDRLFELAYEALARNERSYLVPLKQLATKRTTLAEMGIRS